MEFTIWLLQSLWQQVPTCTLSLVPSNVVSCSSAEANKIHLLSSWRLTPPSPCKFEKTLSTDPIKAVSQIFVSMFSMGMQEQFKVCKPMDFPTMVASRKMSCVCKIHYHKTSTLCGTSDRVC